MLEIFTQNMHRTVERQDGGVVRETERKHRSFSFGRRLSPIVAHLLKWCPSASLGHNLVRSSRAVFRVFRRPLIPTGLQFFIESKIISIRLVEQ